MDFDQIALRRLDLTVLLVFLGLIRHGKAASVAAEMGLTQSAVSHSIARLRSAFDDPLFLRRPHGMEPTSVALALEPAIRASVEALDGALRPQGPFEPARAEGTLRIAAYDNEIASMVPPLLTRLSSAAPGLRLSALALGRKPAMAALDHGDVDVAVGFFWDVPATFRSEPLFSQGYRVVARTGHPEVADKLDLATYLRCRHLVVSVSGDLTGIVDDALAEMGKTRRVCAAVPLFMPALQTVATGDLIATLPARLVDLFAHRFGLRAFEPPLSLRPISISAVIHRRNAANPLHRWVIGQLRELAA